MSSARRVDLVTERVDVDTGNFVSTREHREIPVVDGNAERLARERSTVFCLLFAWWPSCHPHCYRETGKETEQKDCK